MTAESPEQDGDALVDYLEGEIKAYYLARMVSIAGASNGAGTLQEVLTDYLNWQRRQIARGPRAVHRSAELLVSTKAVEHRDLLDRLIQKIVAGDDLTPHLSRSAQTIAKYDAMLSDWGIQHLHFKPEGGMDDLLFAVLEPGHAYLIGIYPHGSWALQELAEIVIRNWPAAGIFLESNYVVGLTRKFTDGERKQLRRAHLSVSSVEIDGKVYSPRVIGQMADGGSTVAARQAMGFVAQIDDLRWNFSDRMAAIRTEGERVAGRALPGEWEPAVSEDGFGLLQDGVFIQIGKLP